MTITDEAVDTFIMAYHCAEFRPLPERTRTALEAAAPLLVAQHEREAWRPIAEAPRTPEHYDLPTYFLMWDGRCVFKGFRGQPPDNDPHWDPDPEFFDENSDGVETPPTHFRLLPSPPASEKERADG